MRRRTRATCWSSSAGAPGRDGIKGATFASKNLSETAESDRSSVQVPDPFMKKLLIDSLLEAAGTEAHPGNEGPGRRRTLDGALGGRRRAEGPGSTSSSGKVQAPRGRHVPHRDNDLGVTGEDAPDALPEGLGAGPRRSSGSTRSPTR